MEVKIVYVQRASYSGYGDGDDDYGRDIIRHGLTD